MKHLHTLTTLGCLSILTACGGGSGGVTPQGFADTLQADEALATRVIRNPDTNTGYFTTQPLLVPSTGSVKFTGIGVGGVLDPNAPTRDLLMRGDAEVTVNFKDNEIDGSITNIVVGELSDTTDLPTAVYQAEGVITISNGSIGTGIANAIAADFDGTLAFDDVTANLDGRMTGSLRGTRPNPNPGQSVVRAIEMTGTGQTIIAGNTTYSADLTIIAESP